MLEQCIQSVGGESSTRKGSGSAGRRSCSAADGSSDDRAVVARILAGDASAFASLVDRHHASFLRLARAWGQGGAGVERIVHECWVEILDGLVGFRFDRSLRTWMLSLVVRRARRRADELLASRPGHPDPGAEQVEAFDRDGRWVDPPRPWDEHRAAAALPAILADAISRLPSAEQAVLTLRDLERLGREDTRAVLGISADAERALLHAARARLRRTLDSRMRAAAGRCAITG